MLAFNLLLLHDHYYETLLVRYSNRYIPHYDYYSQYFVFRCCREVYSSCVGSHFVSGGGPLLDCSLCLLHGSESTQTCLCRPHYSGGGY